MSTTQNTNSTAGSTTTQPTLAISEVTLRNACQMAIKEDKPIMMDYYLSSFEEGMLKADGSREKSVIGLRANDKLLVKSSDEYTSTISKFFKCGTEYLIHTENSIYIVSSQIKTKKVN